MGKFDGILICSDCDGTLTDTNSQLSKENIEAIKYFQSEGGYFTVATGRYPEYFSKFTHLIKPNAPIICCNGIALYDLENKKLLNSISLDNSFDQLMEFALNELEEVEAIYAGSVWTTLDEVCTGKVFSAVDDEIIRIIIIQNEKYTLKNQDRIIERFKDKYSLMLSWGEGIECLPHNCTKATMIPYLKEYLKDVKTVVSVGDYDNDVAMFKASDISYAVDNAPDRVKAYANRKAPNNNNHVLAYIVKDLEENL